MKIKQNIEYGLQGQFKVDVYDRQGDLVDTTDYFTNFITQTGLNYPLYYTRARFNPSLFDFDRANSL